MKFRKSRPSMAASIGRMIVLDIAKSPDASPEKNAVAASTHSSAVTPIPFAGEISRQLPVGSAGPPRGSEHGSLHD